MRQKRDKKPLLVLDLDMTIIDSSIRENLSVNNDILDLEHYMQQKQCPHFGVVTDTLTPLGTYIEENIHKLKVYYNLCILTARKCDNIDYQTLWTLIPNLLDSVQYFICRDNVRRFKGWPNIQSTGEYKRAPILYLQSLFCGGVIVIDDCPKVLEMTRQNKARAICARDLWHYNKKDFTRLFFGV